MLKAPALPKKSPAPVGVGKDFTAKDMLSKDRLASPGGLVKRGGYFGKPK